MSAGRDLLRGAAWIYGAQVVTIVVQFAYAALTSRLVSPSNFGAYAVALSVTGLVTLLATGGLGQTVSRMIEIRDKQLRALVAYALILGVSGGLILYFSAPFWTWLWGTDAAIEPIRWLSVVGLVSPFTGLATGLMARLGKFRQLAILTASSNLFGMGVGAIAVMTLESASSLVVSGAVAQILILIGSVLATERRLIGLARLRYGQADIGFSGRLMLASILSYLTVTVTKFSMTRGIDAASLGQWNRAEVVSVIPFQHIQNALSKTAYPEFRHDIAGSARARIVWTDMLIMTSWVAFILSAGAAVLVPPLVPILFGDGWQIAEGLVAPLAVAGGLQIVTVLLAGAIEALGKFRWVWSTDALLILIQVGAAICIFVYRDIGIAVVALLLTNVARHSWQVWLAGTHGYLEVARLLKNYLAAGAFAAVLGAVLFGLVHLTQLAHDNLSAWIGVGIILVASAAILMLVWRRLPVIVLAKRYGLIQREKR